MTKHKQEALSYAAAGVDIEAGNALVERIKPAVASTKRVGVMGSIGGFGGLFDLKACGFTDPILVAATDGVGTKLLLAQAADAYDTVCIDLVAMCVNDLVVQGAHPLFFLDYYACGVLENDNAVQVIEGIAEGCRQAGCALIGGETAEMPGLYPKGDYDLAGFCVGAVERAALYPKQEDMQEGDVLLGLASSGVHSNGYSLVRTLLERSEADLHAPAPFDASATLKEFLLAPTRIYVRSCLAALQAGGVKGLAHITGGGLTENIPRILPEGLTAKIDLTSWQRAPIFDWLQAEGNLEEAEMLRTFNCGIGMVVVVEQSQAGRIADTLREAGETVYAIGTLMKGNPRVQYGGAL